MNKDYEDYEKAKACLTELLIGTTDYKTAITSSNLVYNHDYASLGIKRYLRKLANAKSFIKIQFIPNSTKFPIVKGEQGQGTRYRYTHSTIRVEVGEHWFLNHFGIRIYKQYEDFDGWAWKYNQPIKEKKYGGIAFDSQDKPAYSFGIIEGEWVRVKFLEI